MLKIKYKFNKYGMAWVTEMKSNILTIPLFIYIFCFLK